MPEPAPTPHLRIVVRSHDGDNGKPRPAYFSKVLALTSMLRAAAELDRAPEFVFYNDGDIPGPRRGLMEASGEVVAVDGGSNRRSYRAAVAREAARPGDAGDILWFAEDDYLYRPDALRHLLGAAAAIPHADYVALYGTESLDTDSPRRRPTYRDLPGAAADPHAVAIDGVRWFRSLNTTSTFAVRRRALREDASLLRLCPFTGGAWDTTTCLVLQGYQPFGWPAIRADLTPGGGSRRERGRGVVRGISRLALNPRSLRRPSRRRVLLGSDPQLISHMDATCGAPHSPEVDAGWRRVASDTAAWAAARGMPVDLPQPDQQPQTTPTR